MSKQIESVCCTRVVLDDGGYVAEGSYPKGRYFGKGIPLYRVTLDFFNGPELDDRGKPVQHDAVEEFVRAHMMGEAVEKVFALHSVEEGY